MLELPESDYLSKQIRQYLQDKTISHIEVLHTPHRFAFFRGEIDTFADLLEGKRITGAVRRGGMVEIHAEENMIVFTDGASLHYYEKAEDFPKIHQMAIYFDDGSALFMSVRMYSIVYVCEIGVCEEDYYRAAFMKPDPFSKEFTFDYFRSLLPQSSKKMSAKAFLATEQRIPGIGNGVLQDILWDAKLDPRYNINECSEEEWHTLYNSVRSILKQMCDGGGRDTESDLFGNKGTYICQLSKNSYMEPCMRCGNPIHKANYMGGTIYFCESCQKRS